MTPDNDLPKFSIVLPSFNTATYMRQTVDSILAQDYPDFELIITDGGSTDGTLEILESYGDRIVWKSEPDDGQCDAINKGFRMATGDLHYWANADDPIEPGTLRHVAERMTDLTRPQWLVGAARLTDDKGREIGRRIVDEVTDTTFLLWAFKWIPTQSVFWNRRMWEAAGPFPEDLHYVMDLGLWLRMHKVAPAIVTERILGQYRLHFESKSLSGIPKSRAERKAFLGRMIARDVRAAAAAGEAELDALTERYAHLFDELSDQAMLVDRLKRQRFLGPLVRLYKRRSKFFPDFEA